jgi:hypothetical protein
MATQAELDAAVALVVPKSIVDAAGDLIIGSADNTVARLAKGADGEVLTTKAGALDWEPIAASGGLVLIEDKLLAADGAIDFTGIPATYKHLRLLASLRSAQSTVAGVNVRFNGDAGNNYDAPGTLNTPSWPLMGFLCGTDRTAGLHAFLVLEIADYLATGHWKSGTWRAGWVDAASNITADSFGHWKSMTAINRLQLIPAAGVFAAGSRATLYGVA